MADADLGEDVVVNGADGAETGRWKRCAPEEFIALARAVKRVRKRECAENLRAAGVTGDPATAALNACDARVVSYADTVALVNQLDGQAEVILLAMRRAEPSLPDAAIGRLGVEPWRWQRIAADLLNVKLQAVGGDGPLPAAAGEPAAAAATATGGARPIGSATGAG